MVRPAWDERGAGSQNCRPLAGGRRATTIATSIGHTFRARGPSHAHPSVRHMTSDLLAATPLSPELYSTSLDEVQAQVMTSPHHHQCLAHTSTVWTGPAQKPGIPNQTLDLCKPSGVPASPPLLHNTKSSSPP
jgi:hypothetical protein